MTSSAVRSLRLVHRHRSEHSQRQSCTKMRYMPRQLAVRCSGAPSPPVVAPPQAWTATAAGGLLAAALLLLEPASAPPAAAETVRLEDVDAPTLQAALRAATEGRLDAAGEGCYRACAGAGGWVGGGGWGGRLDKQAWQQNGQNCN